MPGNDAATGELSAQEVEALADHLTVLSRRMSPDQILALADRLHDVIRYRRGRPCASAAVALREFASWNPENPRLERPDPG